MKDQALDQLVESWMKGNHDVVMNAILNQDTKADVAWWAVTFSQLLPTKGEVASFLLYINLECQHKRLT